MKSVLSLLLIISTIFSFTACATYSDNKTYSSSADSVSSDVVDDRTSTESDLSTPVESATFASTSTPIYTVKSSITSIPTNTPNPSNTARPSNTSTQISTPKPTNTVKASSTSTADNTPKPTNTSKPTNSSKPSSKPTPTNTPKPTNTPENYPKPVFTTKKVINNLPVYVNNSVSAHKIVDDSFELKWIFKPFEYDPQNYYKPYKDMYAVALGNLTYYANYGFEGYKKVTEEYYKISYKNEIWYFEPEEIKLSGDSIVAKDGKSYKLGDVIYHGKNHDIIITTDGEFICSDGCKSERYDAVPVLTTLDDYCRYADASFTDESSGITYPLCASKAMYVGKYGTVYALSNKDFENCYNTFTVVRNSDYQTVSFDDLDDERKKYFLEKGIDKDSWFRWRYSTFIYTLEDAKLQADSFDSIIGNAVYSATFFGG